jgi:hypothetical protein
MLCFPLSLSLSLSDHLQKTESLGKRVPSGRRREVCLPPPGCVFCFSLSLLSCRDFVPPGLNRWWLFFPNSFGLWWLVFGFVVFFSFGFGSKIQLKKSSLGSGRFPVSSTKCFGLSLSFVSLRFRC